MGWGVLWRRWGVGQEFPGLEEAFGDGERGGGAEAAVFDEDGDDDLWVAGGGVAGEPGVVGAGGFGGAGFAGDG